MSNVVPISSRAEQAFADYCAALDILNNERTFKNAERARKAWKEYLKIGLNDQERDLIERDLFVGGARS